MYSQAEERWAGPRALLHASLHVVYEITWANFNLTVSTPTAKPTNLWSYPITGMDSGLDYWTGLMDWIIGSTIKLNLLISPDL